MRLPLLRLLAPALLVQALACGLYAQNANLPPVIENISGSTTHLRYEDGNTGQLSVTATDADGDALTYAWSVLDGPVDIADTAAPLTTYTVRVWRNIRHFGSSEPPDSAAVRIIVTDSFGNSDTARITIRFHNNGQHDQSAYACAMTPNGGNACAPSSIIFGALIALVFIRTRRRHSGDQR